MKLSGILLAVMVLAGLLTGCGDSDIDGVKNGILDFDTSRTVEEVFSAKLDDIEWTKFTSDNNKTVVEVTGYWVNDKNFKALEEAEKKLAEVEASGNEALSLILRNTIASTMFALPMPGDQVLVQFVVNKDDTFEFQYGELLDSDGNIKENKELGLKAATDSVYSVDKFLEMIYE